MKRVLAFVGFTFAVTLIALNIISFSYIYIVLTAAVALFIVSLLLPFFRDGKAVPVMLASIIFACVIFSIGYTNTFMPQSELDGKTARAELQLIDTAAQTDNGYTYTARAKAVMLDNAPQNIKIKLNTKERLEVDYCTSFNADVHFSLIADKAFDSYGYFGDNVFLSASLIDADIDGSAVHSKSPQYFFIKSRLFIEKILADAFEGDTLGLAIAILTGDKSLISPELYSSMKICGISHITAVSGMHISVVCLLLYEVLKLFGCNKHIRTFITLLTLLMYAGIAGFSKSVLRAGIMIIVLLAARLFDSKADALNSLGLACLIICLNPFAVCDVSTLLTVSTVIGVVFTAPQIKKGFNIKDGKAKYITDIVTVSIGVIITTLPVLWFAFGYVSFISIFLNIIVLPVAQAVLIAMLAFILLSGFPILAFIPKAVVKILLGVIIKSSMLCSEKLSFLCRNIRFAVFGIAIGVVLLFFAFSLFLFRKINFRSAVAVILLVFVGAGIINTYEQNHNAYLYINKNGMVVAYDKNSAVVIDMDSKDDYYDLCNIFKSSENIYCFDCDYESDNISADELTAGDIMCRRNGDTFILTLYNKCFEISDDYVTIGNMILYRDVKGRFSSNEDITIKVSKED